MLFKGLKIIYIWFTRGRHCRFGNVFAHLYPYHCHLRCFYLVSTQYPMFVLGVPIVSQLQLPHNCSKTFTTTPTHCCTHSMWPSETALITYLGTIFHNDETREMKKMKERLLCSERTNNASPTLHWIIVFHMIVLKKPFSTQRPGSDGHVSHTQVVSTDPPLPVRMSRAMHTRHIFFFDECREPVPSYSLLAGKWLRPVNRSMPSKDVPAAFRRGAKANSWVTTSCTNLRKSCAPPVSL